MKLSIQRSTLGLVLLVGLACSSGCSLSLPWMRRPGTQAYQQLRATRFDPYADTESAPAFDGARPPQYQVQRSAPTRSQWQLDAQR